MDISQISQYRYIRPRRRQFIAGFGTGGCGTVSLQELLNKQEETFITHEYRFLPWETETKFELSYFYQILIQHLIDFGDMITGDIGFYWLNHIERLLEYIPNLKAICLKREKRATVDSWIQKVGNTSWWTNTQSKYWKKSWQSNYQKVFFPQYDLPRRQAISKYYDHYYIKAEYLQRTYPHVVMIVPMLDLFRKERCQRKVLSFLNIPEDKQVIDLTIHANRGETKGLKKL